MHKKVYHSTPLKNLCLTVPIKFVENFSGFRKNSGIEKFQAKEGDASRFCRNFFFSKDRKNFVGEPF